MNKEEWKDIPDYEGIYQASTHGRIRSLDKIDNMGRLRKGRVLKFKISKFGYACVGLTKNYKLKTMFVHRVALTAFDRLPKDNEECNHKDGNKLNNYLYNLEWVTHLQNMQHKDNVLGKHNRGERCHLSKLTEHQIRNIRKDVRCLKDIAREYKIHISVVSKIRHNKIWKHVECGTDIELKNHNCKLNEGKIIEIRVHLKEGKLTQKQIAEIYGVSRGNISCIKLGKTWGHVK